MATLQVAVALAVRPEPGKYPRTWTAQRPLQLRRVSCWPESTIYGGRERVAVVVEIMDLMSPQPLHLTPVRLEALPHRLLIPMM